MTMTLKYRLHVLWKVFRLRCPNCERGRIFTGLFAMNQTCPYCGVRFERESGESVGGMYFNLVAVELLTMVGFFTINALFEPPFVPHLVFWILFNVVFIAVFYRHARSLWIGISFLTGGVYVDPHDEREYQRPVEERQP